MADNNYGALITGSILVWLVAVGLVGLPILIGGLAVVGKIIQILYFAPVGGVPVWAIFAIGIMFIYLFRRR